MTKRTVIMTAAILAGLLVTAVSALDPPPYIKPCSRNDPNLDECALKSGTAAIASILKGDPKHKVPGFNPMKITEIRLDGGKDANAPAGLDLRLRDFTLYGLDRMELKKVHFDLEKKKIEIAVYAPELRILSQYEMDGKILVVPIKGKGDSSVNMTGVDLVHKLDYELVTKEDGLEYIKALSHVLEPKTKQMKIYLSNLFNSDKALSEYTNRFLNENTGPITAEFGPYLSQAIGEVGRQAITNLIEGSPYKDLFPEKL